MSVMSPWRGVHTKTKCFLQPCSQVGQGYVLSGFSVTFTSTTNIFKYCQLRYVSLKYYTRGPGLTLGIQPGRGTIGFIHMKYARGTEIAYPKCTLTA